MTVRRATLADVEGIVVVRDAYCRELAAKYLELAPHDPESTRRWCFHLIHSPQAVIWVGEQDGTICGVLALMVHPYPINQAVTMCVELMVYVMETARDQGIGTKLFQAGEQWAASQQAAFMIVSYRAGMETSTWFETRGYRPMEPTLVKKIGGSYV